MAKFGLEAVILKGAEKAFKVAKEANAITKTTQISKNIPKVIEAPSGHLQQPQIPRHPHPSEPRAPFVAVNRVKTAEIETIRQQVMESRFLIIENAKKLGFRGDRIKGRLKFEDGFIKANTELAGTQQDAYHLFINLRREMSASLKLEKPTIERFSTEHGKGDRLKVTYSNGTNIQLRPEGKSGHVKIEITDVNKEVKEKITFKTGEN